MTTITLQIPIYTSGSMLADYGRTHTPDSNSTELDSALISTAPPSPLRKDLATANYHETYRWNSASGGLRPKQPIPISIYIHDNESVGLPHGPGLGHSWSIYWINGPRSGGSETGYRTITRNPNCLVQDYGRTTHGRCPPEGTNLAWFQDTQRHPTLHIRDPDLHALDYCTD